MNDFGDEAEDLTVYNVVVNHEGQYSIWPADRENALGWCSVGMTGTKEECLDFINQVWTDMRPLSLRNYMREAEARRDEIEAENRRRWEEEAARPKDPRDDLVTYLCEGSHPVVADIRPDRTAAGLRECLERGFVHIKFTDTRGGTSLGMRVDSAKTDLAKADFEAGKGTVHLEGELKLNYVPVRCVADISLDELVGHGHLERSAEGAACSA